MSYRLISLNKLCHIIWVIQRHSSWKRIMIRILFHLMVLLDFVSGAWETKSLSYWKPSHNSTLCPCHSEFHRHPVEQLSFTLSVAFKGNIKFPVHFKARQLVNSCVLYIFKQIKTCFTEPPIKTRRLNGSLARRAFVLKN